MPFQILLFLVALADVFGGFLIIFNSVSFLHSLFFYFGLFILVKGMWSIATSFLTRFYFDFLGWADVMAGAVLLLLFANFSISFFWFFGVVILVKGLWSILFSV